MSDGSLHEHDSQSRGQPCPPREALCPCCWVLLILLCWYQTGSKSEVPIHFTIKKARIWGSWLNACLSRKHLTSKSAEMPWVPVISGGLPLTAAWLIIREEIVSEFYYFFLFLGLDDESRQSRGILPAVSTEGPSMGSLQAGRVC